MSSPGAAMHHLAAIPHRLLKSLICPSRPTDTTTTECGRSSETRAIAADRTPGEDAASVPPTHEAPTREVSARHEFSLWFPAEWTSNARSRAGVVSCDAARIQVAMLLRSSASVYCSTSPRYPKLMLMTSGPLWLRRALVSIAAESESSPWSCSSVIGR